MPPPTSVGVSHLHRPRAFSLVEAVVVLGLLAVLSTVGMSWWLSTQRAAADRQAQNTIDLALTSVEELFLIEGSFADPLHSKLSHVGLSFTDAESSSPFEVSVALAGTEVLLSVKASSGSCWNARFPTSGPTLFGRSTEPCSASNLDPDHVTATSFSEVS